MGNCVCKIKFCLNGYSIFPNIFIIHSNYPSILHRAALVLVDKNLVIFIESVFVTEELFKKIHRLDCDFENERSHLLHVFKQGFNTI